jgi:protein SCO1/2
MIQLMPLLLSLTGLLPASARATPKPEILNDVKFEQRIGEKLPLDVKLTDEYGDERTIASYLARQPVILVFSYFECPNLCTLVLNGLVNSLKKIPEKLGQDYQVLSVSINPDEKPPLALAKKRAYLARLGFSESGSRSDANLAWHFLTGKESEIRRLADQAGFHYRKDPKSGEYAHPSGIMVISRLGVITQYLFGIEYDPKLLDTALQDARFNRQGSWVNAVLLYCFHYDPKLSRNGPWILFAIRSAGAIGLLILLGTIIYLRRTDPVRPVP